MVTQFEQYVKLNKKVPPEILSSLSGIDDPSRLADTIATHLSVRIDKKQKLLETKDIKARLELLVGGLEEEIDLL